MGGRGASSGIKRTSPLDNLHKSDIIDVDETRTAVSDISRSSEVGKFR